jgi:hypothetical protein
VYSKIQKIQQGVSIHLVEFFFEFLNFFIPTRLVEFLNDLNFEFFY